MSEPLDLARRVASTEAAPWTEHGIEPVGAVERLSPEQPDSGLIWVLSGTVNVVRAGRSHEISKGSVAAYRLGGGLTWSATEATRVRWNARAVRLEPGRVAPWTADLALEIPASDARPAAPRRKPFALMAIALSWIVALTVAWCYDQAKSASLSPTTGILGAMPVLTADQREIADEASNALAALGLSATEPLFPGRKSAKLVLWVQADPYEQGSLKARLGQFAQELFARRAGIDLLRVRLADDSGKEWGSAVSTRLDPGIRMDVLQNQGVPLYK